MRIIFSVFVLDKIFGIFYFRLSLQIFQFLLIVVPSQRLIRQTSAMELFCENSKLLKTIKYFRKMTPLLMFGEVLNTPLLSHKQKQT